MSKHKKKHKHNHGQREHHDVPMRTKEDRPSDSFDEETASEFAPAGVSNLQQAPISNHDELATKDMGQYERFNDRDDDAEAAAEIAPTPNVYSPDPVDRDDSSVEDSTESGGQGIGVVGIILSALAFFLVPFLMGPAGIVLGIISARRGSMLGWWAVGIGAAAILLTAFVAPLAGF
ncbi:hypothetical protein [Marininema halotolerans]|uniref:DUF4190 domain-containing protein n=1 Tax=Marininema halotolerans TaxID=1155944 RepID=A0A1I6SWF5_9BACL|nr:hypothetical protein [Marininema halotolerans]SFS81276.1 hypothetical protein SAMN05444972_10887 [Marininema halotolerans]